MDKILTELKMNVGSWYLWVVSVGDDISFLSRSFKTLNLQHTEFYCIEKKNTYKGKFYKKEKGTIRKYDL